MVSRRRFLASAGVAGATWGFPLAAAARWRDETDLEQALESARAEGHAAGMAAGLVRDGELVWSGGFGSADLERDLPMTAATVMNIASISKTVTATAVMQLWEEGRFGLDDDVRTIVPWELKHPEHPRVAITLRQLLTHTSSITDGAVYDASYACGDPKVSLAEWVQGYFEEGGAFYDREQNFFSKPPESRRIYSNVGFGLLGYLVEVVAGQPFEDFCEERIFTPLGMSSTAWHLARIDRSQHAIPYEYGEAGDAVELVTAEGSKRITVEADGYVPMCLYSFPNYPDGLVRTSVEDFARFLSAYLNGGVYDGNRILKAETVELMLSDQTPESMERKGTSKQGLAWHTFSVRAAGTMWGHSGGDPGVATLALTDRKRNFATMVFCNTSSEAMLKASGRLVREGVARSDG